MNYERKNKLLNGVHPICSKDDDPILGTAAIFYFAFDKQIIIMLSIITFLYIPSLYFNVIGKAFSQDGLNANFATTSLGNLGNTTYRDTYDIIFTKIDYMLVAYIICGCTFLVICFSFWYVLSMQKSVKEKFDKLNRDTVTIADYSVFVRGLPHDATHDEILEHFNNLYKLDGESWEDKGWCCGLLARHKPHDPAEIVDRGYIVSPRMKVIVPPDNDIRSPRRVVKETKVLTPKNNNELLKDWKEGEVDVATELTPKKKRRKNGEEMIEAKLVQITQPLNSVQVNLFLYWYE